MTQFENHPHSGRQWHLDLLRILAIFTIVLIHVSPQGYLKVDVHSGEWTVMNLITCLSCWNVPVFYMISGALFLGKKRNQSIRDLYGKSIIRIITCFIFWSAFYGAAYCFMTGKGKWTFLNQLLRGHYHMWFMFVILGLYWVTPIIRQVTASRKTTEYFLIAGFILTYGTTRILFFLQRLSLPHADVLASLVSANAQINPYRALNALYYYVLGYYLNETLTTRRQKTTCILLGAAGFILLTFLTIWDSSRQGSTSSDFNSDASVGTLLYTLGMFVLFKIVCENWNPSDRIKKILTAVSSWTFGIYLCHPFILERLQPVFTVTTPLALLGQIMGTTILVYLTALGISALLHQIPIARKTIV